MPPSAICHTHLRNGNFPITIKDANGCEDSTIITLDDGNTIISGQTIEDVDCDGTLGAINSFISDDNQYTFTLDSMTNKTGDFDNLAAGVYNFYMTDSMGCDLEQEIIIHDYSFSEIKSVARLNDCGDMFDLRVFNYGGQAPYSYFLNGKEYFNNIISNVPIGNYEVLVIDHNGCEASEIISIEGFNVLSYEIAQCQIPTKSERGFLRIVPTSGVGPFQFNLGPYISQTGLFINLEEVEYALKITDSRGCTLISDLSLCPIEEDKQIRSRNQEDLDFTIYPNPGSNKINIKVLPFTNTAYIYNNLGEKILSKNVVENVTSLRVDISSLPNGIYYIGLDNSDRYRKWIKI